MKRDGDDYTGLSRVDSLLVISIQLDLKKVNRYYLLRGSYLM